MSRPMLMLNVGAGEFSIPGYVPIDKRANGEAFPLSLYGRRYDDGEADVIRSSHLLEHFPKAQIPEVIAEWVRVLKPGGVLRIAVPDFEKVAQAYLGGKNQPTESYVMGGQTDADDFHRSVFDRDTLRKYLADAGLVLLRPWVSEIADCASYPISLNIEGTKPHISEIKVSGALSVPRLGFMDNFFCSVEACIPCNVKLRKHGGAFWGQSMTKVMERILEEDNPDAILTMDYDSIFLKSHLATLMQLMMAHPEADAIAPIQSSRHLSTALFTLKGDDGKNVPRLTTEDFEGDLKPVQTAHFGLTLIRAEKLKALPKPWFHSVPSPSGQWNDDRIDEDINFWRKWEAAGNTLFLANRVVIGHAELMVRLPGKDLQVFYQAMSDFHERHGFPDEVWQ